MRAAWELCQFDLLFLVYVHLCMHTHRAAACDVQGVWLSLILMLQSCNFFKVILEAQVTRICSMDILRLTIDFIKMSCAIELHT